MERMFKKNGTLNIPDTQEPDWQKSIVKKHKIFIKTAYCPNGHNLMSDVRIDDYRGIHLLYRGLKDNKEAEIVITACVGDTTKVYLKGDDFKKNEIVAIYCPTCKSELPTHGDCKCSAHNYLLFLDERRDRDCAQTFCSRIGCAKASRLHVIEDEDAVVHKEKGTVVTGAYCPNGHSLISDVKINQHRGIHLIYKDRETDKQAEIVISPIVGKRTKVMLKGDPFKQGHIVDIYCPFCRVKLPILLNCECGAPVYMFYLDKTMDFNHGQSFCSRIGCVESSRLHLSQQVLREFMVQHCS